MNDENKKLNEEEELDIITLEDENGNEITFEFIGEYIQPLQPLRSLSSKSSVLFSFRNAPFLPPVTATVRKKIKTR